MRMGNEEGFQKWNFISLYRSSNIIRMNKYTTLRWAVTVSRMNKKRGLRGKTIGKKSLRSTRRRCEDNIRTDITEIGIDTRKLVDSAQDGDNERALVNSVLNFRVP